jgi:hypothetical protein
MSQQFFVSAIIKLRKSPFVSRASPRNHHLRKAGSSPTDHDNSIRGAQQAVQHNYYP